LNKQELRHSTYWGPFIKLMEELSEDQFWPDCGLFSANDFRRMLDVEYISELAICHLHGPQNKKDRLDDWYATYESGFSESREVKATFQAVIGELSQTMPDLRRTRWRNKSDFYTLFDVLSTHKGKLPLASDKRELLRTELVRFGEEVSAGLAKDAKRPRRKLVRSYVSAVERAATDVANREARSEALASALKQVLSG
ncbi:MAG: DUF262 domain-containing protein, partial [Solirubrobacterales bacterium]